jgi:CheY-like chemotaxis protein
MAYILLAEDDDDCAAVFLRWLERAGHEVEHVHHGHAGLISALEERRPDLIVTDYKMPEMDGKEMASILHVALPEVPVLVVTGYMEATRQALLEDEPNVVEILAKPLEMDRFLASVERGLATPAV